MTSASSYEKQMFSRTVGENTIYGALKEQYGKYPLRTCRYGGKWNSECHVCEEPIKKGEQYYDGCAIRRAHEECVNPVFI